MAPADREEVVVTDGEPSGEPTCEACGSRNSAAPSPPIAPKHLLSSYLRSTGGDPVEQVHVAPGRPGEALVTFLTRDRVHSSDVLFAAEGQPLTKRAAGAASVYTMQVCVTNEAYVRWPSLGEVFVPDEGLAYLVNTSRFLPETSDSYVHIEKASEAWENLHLGCVAYKNPLGYRTSPFVHTAVLTGLQSGTRYSYRPEAGVRNFSFTLPPAAGEADPGQPLRLGIWSDVGTTAVSEASMRQLVELKPDLVLLGGDYAYAEGWPEVWDTFGRMMEPLMAWYPMLGAVGNHEIDGGHEQGKNWEMRYPQPTRYSGSESTWWYSYEVGLVHILVLAGSYAETEPGSPQFGFARRDLERVDRARTPWIVVVFHVPWYNSNVKHFQEALKHQVDMEDLLYEHGVDLVVGGHVHSYERSHPVYKDQRDPCGPVHIVIGDGGNFEGPALPWMPQPDWSAFRQASFGVGVLTVHNESHAAWDWGRTACVQRDVEDNRTQVSKGPYTWDGAPGKSDCATTDDGSEDSRRPVDSVVLIRDVKRCPARQAGTGPGLPGASAPPAMSAAAALPGLPTIAASPVGHGGAAVFLLAALLVSLAANIFLALRACKGKPLRNGQTKPAE